MQPTFSDGHASGIFSWEYLHYLGTQQDTLWKRYEERLAAAGKSRDAPMSPAAGGGGGGGGCGHKH